MLESVTCLPVPPEELEELRTPEDDDVEDASVPLGIATAAAAQWAEFEDGTKFESVSTWLW